MTMKVNLHEFVFGLDCTEAANEIARLRQQGGTRWHDLFGTPERAARTLLYVLACKDSRPWVSCGECPILDGCKARGGGYDALLEWLREGGE